MTQEQTFFTGVLADHLNKKKTASADGLNWDLLLSYAKSHQVEAILYYQCKDFLPPEIRGRLTQLYASTLFYYTNRSKQFEEICRSFAEREVSFYPVKGLDVAELYPVPALRTMGDCDIIVHSVDKNRAHDIMISLGYENTTQQDTEWRYIKNRLEFEIHDHLLYDELVNSQISQDFTELAWEYAKRSCDAFQYELDWSFHFVFLILHLKKHFLNSGVGFRQFIDLAVVAQSQEIDWTWVEKTLTELELLRFSKVCFTLCKIWFGIKMPLTCDLSDEFIEQSTEKVFRNGVFGFNDESNQSNQIFNIMRNLKRIKTLLSLCFPTYNNVRFVPYYSFVNGKPWLLPVVWIYRPIWWIFRKKRTNGLRMITNAVLSGRALESRNSDLEQWGL